MIIPKLELNELLDGLEAQLMPAMEETTKLVKVRGSVMLANEDNHYQTPGGIMLPVQANKNYLYHKSVQIPVNHRRRIKQIIEKAATQEEWEKELSKYLFKYGDKNKYINRKS